MNIKQLVEIAWTQSESKGFHEDPTVTFGDRIALVHSEVSEALEAYRSSGNISCNIQRHPEDAKGKPEGVPSELADVVIRIADMAGVYGIDLEAAIVEKLAFNLTRPHRHGKARL